VYAPLPGCRAVKADYAEQHSQGVSNPECAASVRARLTALAACALLSSAAWGQTVPLVADTYISQANPNNNYGTFPALSVGPSSSTLVMFDISSLAGMAEANIGHATLTIFVNKALVAGQIYVLEVFSPCTAKRVTNNSQPPTMYEGTRRSTSAMTVSASGSPAPLPE